MAVVPHPPYSADPAPCNFFFPKMQSIFKGAVSGMSLKIGNNRWPPYVPFKKVTSNDASRWTRNTNLQEDYTEEEHNDKTSRPYFVTD
jgi:hypothetical protein